MIFSSRGPACLTYLSNVNVLCSGSSLEIMCKAMQGFGWESGGLGTNMVMILCFYISN